MQNTMSCCSIAWYAFVAITPEVRMPANTRASTANQHTLPETSITMLHGGAAACAQLVQPPDGSYQADFGQCGGADGYCAGVQGLQCADVQWLACAPTSSCVRITSLYWQARMLTRSDLWVNTNNLRKCSGPLLREYLSAVYIPISQQS